MNGLAAVHLSTGDTTTRTTTQPKSSATATDRNTNTTNTADAVADAAAASDLLPATSATPSPPIRSVACSRVRHQQLLASGEMTSAAADRSVVLARVCESELAAVRRASSAGVHPVVHRRTTATMSTMSATNGRGGTGAEVLCNGGARISGAATNGARSEAVGINAAGAGVNNDGVDTDEDPYAELEFYLENVKVSAEIHKPNPEKPFILCYRICVRKKSNHIHPG